MDHQRAQGSGADRAGVEAVTPAAASLANALRTVVVAEEVGRRLMEEIASGLLVASRHVRQPSFTSIHTSDLEYLFECYDRTFFAGLCRQALDGRRLTFRLAPRMTSAGGKTTRFRSRAGEVSYEIAIGTSVLYDGFRETDRDVTVCGRVCASRLEALLRIFEHELLHLAEQLCWGQSSCAGARFQRIAAAIFGHRAHTHALITRRERAAEAGIRVGARVSFPFEGRRLTGKVNRVTKRVTVLVEDPAGRAYTDGRRYRVYYVPLGQVEAG